MPTVTENVIQIALSRKQWLLDALPDPEDGAGVAAHRRYLLTLESASVWAERPGVVICDVPDTAAAEIHGEGITSAILDIDVTQAGAPVEWSDRAEITQLSPTRARLTF